jgi:two-component system response regulator LytT
MQQADHRFAVEDATVAQSRLQAFTGPGGNAEMLVGFRTGRTGPQPARMEEDHAFAEQPGAGIERAQPAQLARAVTGFLDQLAPCGLQRRFARLDTSGHQFPQHPAHRMPVLLHQQDTPVGQLRDHHNGPEMHHEIPDRLDTSRFAYPVSLDRKNLPTVQKPPSVHTGERCSPGSLAGHPHPPVARRKGRSGSLPACRRSSYTRNLGCGPMQITTIIVDDEKPARDELAYLLKSLPEIRLVGQGRNGLEAVSLIKEHAPDLVFLDVEMPGLDGFGVIRKLIERRLSVPYIVFATAYDHYAVHAFEVNAIDYVLKPFERERIARAVERARQMLEARAVPAGRLEALLEQLTTLRSTPPPRVLLKAQGRLLLASANDIVYAAIEEGVITLYTRDLEGTTNFRTLEELQQALGSEQFWRPHRSYLVNINQIREVVPWFKSGYLLRMADQRQSEIPVSRSQTRRLRELFRL